MSIIYKKKNVFFVKNVFPYSYDKTFQLLMTIKSENDFFFAHISGETYTKKFRSIIKKLGLKKIRFHDLRHSHASLLLSLNEDDFTITKRMGHASSSFTKDVYGHLFDDTQ